MYREKYCQRRAVEMYASGKTKAEVIQMLVEENAKEAELQSLADRFYEDYEFLQKENRKKRQKNADRDTLIGSVIMAAGVVLSLLSYLFMDNGNYVLFTGIIIAGLIFLGKGTVEKMHLRKETSPKSPT